MPPPAGHAVRDRPGRAPSWPTLLPGTPTMHAWKLKRELRRIGKQIVTLGRDRGHESQIPDEGGGRSFVPVAMPTSIECETQPRCAVVAMVRNEADRAHEVMRHFCALFDLVVVVDHMSVDDTGRIVAGYDGHGDCSVVTLRSNEPGYYQSDYMTACVRGLVDQAAADWVFLLDFDEFLPFASRHDFHQALVQFVHADVIHGHWLNCLPRIPGGPVRDGAEVVTADVVSRYVKIAVNARRLQGREVSIEQGNHAVRLDGDPLPQIGERGFGVMHFPIVSIEKLDRKVREGVAAYEATIGTAAVNGFHWREMLDRLECLRDDPDLVAEIALRYGEPMEAVLQDYASRPEGRVPRRTFRVRFAQVAPAEPAPCPTPAEITRETLTHQLCAALPAAGDGPVCGGTLAAIYGTLPAAGGSAAAGDDAWITRAIMAGTQHLEFVMPTAWAGHEPFLFTLMEAMRPRRYVELGTHAGHSFFTACQHYKSHGDYGEAVAIDLWEGDHQAGFYDERVFEDFRTILRQHYAACGRYIRGRFAEAATVFAPGSIDLLHIDGLHTYAAVREDYETWRPKLTEQGVVLFHDTSEYQSDFGVWQFFAEVQGEATEWFNFRHGHGLGVLAFGDESSPAVRLLRRLREEPALFERHYAILGAAMFRSRRAEIEAAGRGAA